MDMIIAELHARSRLLLVRARVALFATIKLEGGTPPSLPNDALCHLKACWLRKIRLPPCLPKPKPFVPRLSSSRAKCVRLGCTIRQPVVFIVG